jgi:hypothetical protein
MTPLRPYTVARYGVYLAAAVAALSVWLGLRAGVALDYALLRAVFFFVIVAGLSFGAEAVLLLTPIPPARPAPEAADRADAGDLETE